MTKSFLPPPEAFATFPAPNYENPETRGTYTIATAIVCGTLSIVFVFLRLLARLRIKKGLGWDDFWILFGLVFGICFYVNIIVGTKIWGYQFHIWDLPPRLYKGAAIIEITAVLFFLLSTSGVRLSLLSFYLHLVKDAGSLAWKRTIYGFVAVTVLLSLAFGLTAVFRCTPLSAYWTYPMPEDAYCFDESIITLIGGCLVVIADLCTMLLPLPVVLRFNMPFRQRISVAVLLSLGLIVTFVSTARTVYLWKSLLGTYDITWESHPLLICGSIEILLSIICACLPSIKPLYEKFCNWCAHRRAGFRTFRDSNSSSTGNTYTTAKPSRRQKNQAKTLSLDLSNSNFSKGTIHAMYPLATITSITGKLEILDEEPPTPNSWLSGGKGSSGTWLSSGKLSSGPSTPMSWSGSSRASSGPNTPTSLPSPSRSASFKGKNEEVEEVGSEREDVEEQGITVVKSVDVEYSPV